MSMDISSELVHSLLPIFMTTILGASMMTIGVIEGIAESAAAITKVFSGTVSDYLKKRKFIIVLGYGLSAFTKPIFPLSATIWWVFGARFIDRIGKGIRGAPRDALVADLTPSELRGAAYGLRQSLDTVGAFIGPILALVFMFWFSDNIKAVLWVAVIPAFIAVFLLIVGVSDPKLSSSENASKNHLTWRNAKQLNLRYWLVVALGAVLTLARFSEAFLILRASDVGLAMTYLPAIPIVMNVVYAFFAYPFGLSADHLPARILLVVGLGLLVTADIVLAWATTPGSVFIGVALWGLHLASTQGLLSKLVADTAPDTLRGTAFGFFNLVSGVALLLASVIAGSLWNSLGASATFIAGAFFAALTATGLLFIRPTQNSQPSD